MLRKAIPLATLVVITVMRQCRLRLSGLIAVGLTIAALAPPSHAIEFYAVDNVTDEFVLIDSDTGDVTLIGDLGADAGDVELARLGETVYALNLLKGVIVQLWEIDPLTGAVASSATVTLDGALVLHAEGLAAVGGGLAGPGRNSGHERRRRARNIQCRAHRCGSE